MIFQIGLAYYLIYLRKNVERIYEPKYEIGDEER